MNLKPLRKPGPIPVLQEVRGRALAGFADQLLLDGARVLSEGSIDRDADEGPTFFGSTLVTIELDSSSIVGAGGAVGSAELVEAARRSISLNIRLMRIARAEAERRSAPLVPRGMLADFEFKIEDTSLLVDISVECPLADPSEDVEDAGARP
jgi:hypothetical protein